MKTIRFTVPVFCNVDVNGSILTVDTDPKNVHLDHGLLMLPDTYTEDGAPTRLVINCHGAGGTVATNDSQVEHQELTKYLLANGYAVMDVNGLPESYAKENGIDLRNNVGSPIALRCYREAYDYCMERYNLYPEVFVHGGSMGGISSTNLVLLGHIPVIAHSSLCPVLDTYNQIFLHPWSGGLPKTALGKLYGFEKDAEGEYLYDESKVGYFNPARCEKAVRYPVPVKFWHCRDDSTVAFSVTEEFVRRVNDHGGDAHLVALPHGGHEPQLVGQPIDNPSGNALFEGQSIPIRPVVEDVFLWIRRFDET